tara:strand:- start:840 stop:1202 length:363 start_codon:yes stop_codon:yes gene_type:complete
MKAIISIICIIFSTISLAKVDINPSYLDFGVIEIDNSDTQSIYILNETESPKVIKDVSFFGSFEIFVDNYCPDVLLSGDECEIEVTAYCESFGFIDGSLDIEIQGEWPETVFVEAECSNF